MSVKVKVTVMLKPSILDPQGQAINMALHGMGYGEVTDARMGKVIELNFEEGTSPDEAQKRATEMAEKLLSNPVMETFTVELV